jgi:hypothetical protein
MKMRAKSRRNERGYDLEKSRLWIGTRKGHTHYPVPGSFSVSKRSRKNIGGL